MSFLWACRCAFLTMIGLCGLTMLFGVLGLIEADMALLVGILSGLGIAVAALFCVAAQVGGYFSRNRQMKHG